MELRVELSTECPKCNGNGAIYPPDARSETCPTCYGMGIVPTYEGEELLEFFQRFGLERSQRRTEYLNRDLHESRFEPPRYYPEPDPPKPDPRKH